MIKYKWLWPKYEKGGGILRQFCSIKNFIIGSQAKDFDWISWFFFASSVFNRYPRIRREIKNYQKWVNSVLWRILKIGVVLLKTEPAKESANSIKHCKTVLNSHPFFHILVITIYILPFHWFLKSPALFFFNLKRRRGRVH